MKLLTLLLFGILLLPSSLFSQSEADQIREELSLIQGQSNLGTDFWFAMPEIYYGISYESFYIVISTLYDNEITISCESKDIDIFAKIKAGKDTIIELSAEKYSDYIFKSNNERIISRKQKSSGININSSLPISVQTYNSYWGLKNSSIAIPTNSLGTDYMIQTYFSNYFSEHSLAYPPCVSVTAAYDGTIVELLLSSFKKELKIRFENGDSLLAGESTTIKLDKGDVWNIYSVDSTGDLSGSIVKSSKPVNLQYSHKALSQPKEKRFADDIQHIIFPSNSWGKTYAIPTYRELNEFPTIRIFTQHDDAKIYRNGVYWTTIDNSFDSEIFESKIWTGRDREDEFGIISPTIITSDKPISIMVFPDYHIKGNALNEIPFYKSSNMNVLNPLEQSVNFAFFSLFSLHEGWVYGDSASLVKAELVFELDDKQSIPDDLEFAILDSNNDTFVWKSLKKNYSSSFVAIEVDNRLIASKEIELPDSCNFYLKSEKTKFSGFVYKACEDYNGVKPGISKYEDFFGFQIGSTVIDLSNSDTKTPIVTLNEYYNGNMINGLVYDNHESTSKLAQLYLLEEYTSNFEFKIISADRGFISNAEGNSFVSGEPVQLEFELNKIEADKDAFAVIYTSDRAGNDTLIFINEDIFTSIEPQETLSEYILVTQQSIEILPNAIADGFTVLEIFDMNGSKVAKAGITAERNISLSRLLSGSYVITLKNDERLLTRKINVVR